MTIQIFNLKPTNAASFWGSKSVGNMKSASVCMLLNEEMLWAEQVIQVKYWHENLASAIVRYTLMEPLIYTPGTQISMLKMYLTFSQTC